MINNECPPSMDYDPMSQICCSGNIRNIQSRDDECCGAEVYNPNGNAKCCDYFDDNTMKYNLSAIPIGSDKDNVQCCGAVAMDNTKSACCFSNFKYAVNDDPTKELYMCCGLKLFDRKKQVCCVGLEGEIPAKTYLLYPLEGNKTSCCATKTTNELYYPESSRCCGGKVIGKELGCCGEKAFNKEKEFCCYDTGSSKLVVLTKNTPDDACCGGAGRYNAKVDLCCNGLIIRNGLQGTRKCCSNVGLYDPATEICCVSREMKTPIIISKDDPGTDPNHICNHNLDYILKH